MHKLSSTTEKKLAEMTESFREEFAAEAKSGLKAKPKAKTLAEIQSETDVYNELLKLAAPFISNLKGNSIFSEPTQMAPPSLEKLLKFRDALAKAARPEIAHMVPTEEAVRNFGANLPNIH